MEKYSIIFLRHGESKANLDGAFQGQRDTELTDRGKHQVLSLAEHWLSQGRHFDLIISSPLMRAKQTAEIMGKKFNTEVVLEQMWMERDTGKLTGMNRQEAKNSPYYLDFFTPYQSMGETGEGDFELFLRGGNSLNLLLKKPIGSYLVISHGGILNQVLHAIIGSTPQAMGQGVTFRLVNTGYAELTYDPALFKWTFVRLNDLTHLDLKDFDNSILNL